MAEVIARAVDVAARERLIAEGIDPRLAHLYAARAVTGAHDLDTRLAALLSPATLAHADRAARLLADAIDAGRALVIVADYDADGATACALGLRALRDMGARVDFVVPNRFTMGYGLTPDVVALAVAHSPDILITVDNGIASVEGVAEAHRRGIEVLVTDHHLPGAALPDAAAIVNPNQPGDAFASKSLAGVGVLFYTMMALRTELRARGRFAGRDEPNLADLLDLVALGTVADVVRLDRNNRVLVEQGLQRIRAGRMTPGIRALFEVAGRDPAQATVHDLGFALGPRLNAAGRLDDMATGIACLSAPSVAAALPLARELDRLNRERRTIEAGMREVAFAALDTLDVAARASLTLFEPDWHQGVVGILAGRVREKTHRPVIAFARDGSGGLKGSGRSIPALHLRDCLDLVAKRHPALIGKFGGHAAAAGLSIREAALADFTLAFEQAARHLLTPADLAETVETDGAISGRALDFAFVQSLQQRVWGQGFAAPSYLGALHVLEQRVVGERHLKVRVSLDGETFEAMRFGSADSLPARIDAVFKPAINTFRGISTVQLTLEHIA